MPRSTSRSAVVTLLALTLTAPVHATEPVATTSPIEADSSTAPDSREEATFTLGPPRVRSIGSWREIAHVANGDILLGDLLVVSERLVVPASVCDMESCRDVSYHSADGVTWVGSVFPGARPAIYDVAVTPDGSMAVAVGLTHERGSPAAGAVWSTRDGIEWTPVEAPPVREIDWVAASADAVVASGGDGLWVSRDLESWRRVRGPGPLPVVFGRGGFVAFGGGGQDVMSATEVWQSSDGRRWSKVKLPRALRTGHPAFGGIQVFALDDRWVLIPDGAKPPGAIYVSPDGRDWRRAPRPRWMVEGYVWWIDDVVDNVELFGWAPGQRGQPSAMWEWQLGKGPGRPVWWKHDRIGRPVLWNGQRIALGEDLGPAGGVVLWQWEPTAGDPMPPSPRR